VEKVLYLDADTIILEDLTKLVNINFNENCILAVAESRFVLNSAPQSLVSGKLIANEYFNAGVMYIDVTNWKSESISNELINTGKLHRKHIRYWDQDILNIYFKNKIGEIDSEYNVFRSQTRLNPPPKIVHFAGPVKPWHLFNSHPYRKEYKHFRNLTPFSFKYVGGAAPKAILIQYLGQFGVGRGVLRIKRYFSHKKQS
jgi:lipopolysaccharide biosynthesis glycosyltransferase